MIKKAFCSIKGKNVDGSQKNINILNFSWPKIICKNK